MKVSVLIPTCNRITALAATLTALMAQSYRNFSVAVADQGEQEAAQHPSIQTICRIMQQQGIPVQLLVNLPKKGIAQQRQFLLDHSDGQYSLFLDDDVILEPDALERMLEMMDQEKCGFTGMALIGLSYAADKREHEQQIEFWEGHVQPETVRPGSKQWLRHKLHNAANILHAGQKIDTPQKYKVAWLGGCVLYDTARLREIGGFGFWQQLPEEHCGEDVMVQLKLMEKYGGFGIIPSGAYHQELPTTLPNREVNVPEYLMNAER